MTLILGKRLSQRPVQHMGHGMVGCHFAAVLIVHLKCVIRKIQVFGKAYLAAILGKISIIFNYVAGCITEICQVNSTLPLLLARKPRKRPPHLPSRRQASAPHARHIPQRPGCTIESCHSRTAWKQRVGNANL